MDLSERILFMALGGAIGFILGYIVRDIRLIKDRLDVEEGRNKDERGAVQYPNFRNLALLLVVMLTAYAAFASQSATNQIKDNIQQQLIDRCKGAEENRGAQRTQVEAIYNLAISVIQPREELTTSEVIRTNNYIDQVNKFRSSVYRRIQPTPECYPYVDDQGVKPPSDPFPSISTTRKVP